MRFNRMFAAASALALCVGLSYAAPTGPINRVVDPGQPSQLHYVVNPSAFLTTTDFEGPIWDVGFGMCGDEFAAGCGNPPGSGNGGFANVCVAKNHAASINCCFNDPNEETGWFLSGSSQHCENPIVSTANPAGGLSHLRFYHDANGGNPNGCSGFGGACRVTAFYSDGVAFPASDANVTTFTVDIAGSAALGSSLIWGVCEYQAPAVRFNTYTYMYYLGGIYQYDFVAGAFVFGGYWTDNSPGYGSFRITLDPCSDTITYEYGPLGSPAVFHVEPFTFVPPNSQSRTGGGTGVETNAGIYLTDHFGETWDIDNQVMDQGPGCPDACCDGVTGTCADGVDLADCTGPSFTWHENNECANVECLRDTGACCDSSPGAGGPGPEGACTETLPEDCTGAYHTWTKRATCDQVTCNEVTGGCCRLLTGTCEAGVLIADCSGAQDRWTVEDDTCAGSCEAVTGACCDGDTFGSCTETTQAACSCQKCAWTKLATCGDIECTHEAIPTVSEWGLAVMTLLLLIGAKVYFSRREAIA